MKDGKEKGRRGADDRPASWTPSSTWPLSLFSTAGASMLRLSWLLLPCLVAATHMKKRCVLHNTTAEAAEALTSLVSLRTRLGDWYEEVRAKFKHGDTPTSLSAPHTDRRFEANASPELWYSPRAHRRWACRVQSSSQRVRVYGCQGTRREAAA